MPSGMALHPGNVQGYNNEIQIAGSNAAIGHNPGINEAEPINPASEGDKAFQGKTASPAGTVHNGPQPTGEARTPETNDDGTSAVSPEHPARVAVEWRVMGRRRSTKKKKRPLWPLG